MVVSRNLSMSIKLNGFAAFKKQMRELLTDATQLQALLSNLTVNVNGVGSSLSSNLNTQLVKPLDDAVKTVKAKTGDLQKYSMGYLGGIANYASNVNSVKPIKQLPNITPPSYSGKSGDIFHSWEAPGYFQRQMNQLGTYASYENEQRITDLRKKQLELGNQMAAKFKAMNLQREDDIKRIYKLEQEKIQMIQQRARSLVQTGFGLHIVQIYLAPILYALEQISAKIISTYSEFDKTFTNYMVKSEEYGEWLSKSDFYSASIGQTYGIKDATITAERFAASGIDVAKSQKALTSVMQVATIAQMDYSEAANGVIQTMQAMHMQVTDVNTITDALINSANASTAELKDLVQWFEYAASSAYQAGLSVNQLAAYLGVLSSTGTPNTGAAMRQLFLQLSKEDIQGNLQGAFSWITPDDFQNIDDLILKMREYVRAQDDQKAATLSITRLLGGKANAQQALNNLIMAEPELWNQVNNAVNKTGSTQELYNKITDNAADAIERIKVNLDIWFAQLGEVFGPGLKVVADVFTSLTEGFVALPSFIKKLIGVCIILATVFAAITFGAIGIVGAIAIMAGTVRTLTLNEALLATTTHGWGTVLKNLAKEIYTVIFAGTSFEGTIKRLITGTLTASTATKNLTASHVALNSAMWGITGAMMGYAVSSSAMQKHMYSEAYLVGHLTAMWLAYNAAKMGSALGPVGAIGGALLVGGAYEALMYDQIESMKRDVRLEGMAGKLSGSTTKNYNINAENITVSSEGTGLEDWLSALEVDDSE